MANKHTSEESQLPPPRLEEVSEGIFAYVQPDGTWMVNNAGFLIGERGVLVVDTCGSEARARRLLQAICEVTDRPVRTLLNTHHHGDHTYGNFVLPAATIIGHELCRVEMLETGLATTSLFPGVDFGSIEIAPPFVTFEDRLNLYVDDVDGHDLKGEAIFMGPAHTTNDVVLWLPERKVLFTGDLVFHQATPFAFMGSIAGWLRALDRLRALGAETVVPGHGPVCGPEVFDEVAAYLRFVQSSAQSAFEAGISPLEAARQTDLGRFSSWPDSERLVGNLHRAYSELRGEPLGTRLALGPAAGDMVDFHGGPLRCLV